MPVTISLDAIGNPDEVRVRKNLGPTDQIESGLRSRIWELDGDRHEGMIRQKTKICIDTHPAGQRRRDYWLHRCGVSCPGKVSTVSEGVNRGACVRFLMFTERKPRSGGVFYERPLHRMRAQDIRMEFGQISPEKDRPFGVDVSERVR